MTRAAGARTGLLFWMLCVTNIACPYPTQFGKEDPEPNHPPVIDVDRTTPYYTGGTLEIGQSPVLTIWVDEPDLEDELRVRVVQDLHETLNSGVPPKLLLPDAIIGINDVPPPEEDEPPSVRTRQFELLFSPCPDIGSAGVETVLTVCVADRGFDSEPEGVKDPCLPLFRNAELENRGYTARYTISYICGEDS